MADERGQPKGVQFWGHEGPPTRFHGEWRWHFDSMLLIFDAGGRLGPVTVRLERRPQTPESPEFWEGLDQDNRVMRLWQYAFSRCERNWHSGKLHWVQHV